MLRVIVCSAAMIGVIAAIRYGANFTFDNFGFWPGMIICGLATLLVITGSFLYDFRERANNRSQVVLPPEPSDHQL